MSKKKSSQVHCIPSGDHILMTASTSKHISQIRLYKAWKGNNVINFIFFLFLSETFQCSCFYWQSLPEITLLMPKLLRFLCLFHENVKMMF